MILSKGKILIIEDTAGFRRTYQDALEAAGYEVIDADDGAWGLQLAIEEKPDLILLDLMLPGMSGFEVLEELGKNHDTRRIPVMVLSVLGEGRDIRKARELGARDYAVKGSVSPQDVLTKIRILLEEAEQEPQVVKYRVTIRETMMDATKLASDVGFTHMLMCPRCNGKVVLELVPVQRMQGKWFSAHFVCSSCDAQF